MREGEDERSNQGEAREQRGDDGVSTVFGCLMVGLLIVVTAVCLRLGGAILARQQAEAAADLGALAGARNMLRGSAVACADAGRVILANRASMTSCRADGLDLLVQAEVPVQVLGGGASARARAGPVTTP